MRLAGKSGVVRVLEELTGVGYSVFNQRRVYSRMKFSTSFKR